MDNQDLELKANNLLIEVFQQKQDLMQGYYNRRKVDETLQLGFSTVGMPDEESEWESLKQILQPGFIFEVIVIEKKPERGQLDVLLHRFLSFCDKCQSSSQKFREPDFNLFRDKKKSLSRLSHLSAMRIRAFILDSEVIEDFSIFTYFINYEKIQPGDHLNAVLLNSETMALSLKNKIIMNGKQWSLQNLYDPHTFDHQIFFRLGYSQIGLDFSQITQDQVQKQKEELEDNLRFKEEKGVLKMEYQIRKDMSFANKQNYALMLDSLGLHQRSTLMRTNLQQIQDLDLDHRRRFILEYIFCIDCPTYPSSRSHSHPDAMPDDPIYRSKYNNKLINSNFMSKQGWGFSGNTVKLDTKNKVDKKLNIWEKAGEANDIQYIPDAEEETKPQNQIADAGPVQGQKLQNFNELQTLTRITSLPAPHDDVDLSVLTQVMRPYEDIGEIDESWEFQKLKTELQGIVTKLYAYQAK